MEERTKILMWVLIIASVGSIALTYYRTIYAGNYIISQQISCDPTTEKCFALEAENAGESTTYYKLIEKKAANFPKCAGECEDPKCLKNETDCKIIFCDPGNLKDNEKCSS